MATATAKKSYFDTHTFVKKLIAAKIPKRAAELLADEFAARHHANLATKSDIDKAKFDVIKIVIGGVLALLAIQTTITFHMIEPLLAALP